MWEKQGVSELSCPMSFAVFPSQLCSSPHSAQTSGWCKVLSLRCFLDANFGWLLTAEPSQGRVRVLGVSQGRDGAAASSGSGSSRAGVNQPCCPPGVIGVCTALCKYQKSTAEMQMITRLAPRLPRELALSANEADRSLGWVENAGLDQTSQNHRITGPLGWKRLPGSSSPTQIRDGGGVCVDGLIPLQRQLRKLWGEECAAFWDPDSTKCPKSHGKSRAPG